jgi:hypothetical protein
LNIIGKISIVALVAFANWGCAKSDPSELKVSKTDTIDRTISTPLTKSDTVPVTLYTVWDSITIQSILSQTDSSVLGYLYNGRSMPYEPSFTGYRYLCSTGNLYNIFSKELYSILEKSNNAIQSDKRLLVAASWIDSLKSQTTGCLPENLLNQFSLNTWLKRNDLYLKGKILCDIIEDNIDTSDTGSQFIITFYGGVYNTYPLLSMYCTQSDSLIEIKNIIQQVSSASDVGIPVVSNEIGFLTIDNYLHRSNETLNKTNYYRITDSRLKHILSLNTSGSIKSEDHLKSWTCTGPISEYFSSDMDTLQFSFDITVTDNETGTAVLEQSAELTYILHPNAKVFYNATKTYTSQKILPFLDVLSGDIISLNQKGRGNEIFDNDDVEAFWEMYKEFITDNTLDSLTKYTRFPYYRKSYFNAGGDSTEVADVNSLSIEFWNSLFNDTNYTEESVIEIGPDTTQNINPDYNFDYDSCKIDKNTTVWCVRFKMNEWANKHTFYFAQIDSELKLVMVFEQAFGD